MPAAASDLRSTSELLTYPPTHLLTHLPTYLLAQLVRARSVQVLRVEPKRRECRENLVKVDTATPAVKSSQGDKQEKPGIREAGGRSDGGAALRASGGGLASVRRCDRRLEAVLGGAVGERHAFVRTTPTGVRGRWSAAVRCL